MQAVWCTQMCLWCSNDEVATRFEQLDADHNGVLSPDEVSAVLQDSLGLDAANASHMIEMFDTNRDGNLDKTEFMALWSSMFGPWAGRPALWRSRSLVLGTSPTGQRLTLLSWRYWISTQRRSPFFSLCYHSVSCMLTCFVFWVFSVTVDNYYDNYLFI